MMMGRFGADLFGARTFWRHDAIGRFGAIRGWDVLARDVLAPCSAVGRFGAMIAIGRFGAMMKAAAACNLGEMNLR